MVAKTVTAVIGTDDGRGGLDMSFEEFGTYVFTPEAVREDAPSASGVYAIFTPAEWVFIGASDDMRQALFQHLNAPDPCVQQYSPLSFSCELADASERAGRRDALIAELRPVCDATAKSDVQGHE
jgi:hypothetical protein